MAGKTVWSPRYTQPISDRLSSDASRNKLYNYPDYYSYSYNNNVQQGADTKRTTHIFAQRLDKHFLAESRSEL